MQRLIEQIHPSKDDNVSVRPSPASPPAAGPFPHTCSSRQPRPSSLPERRTEEEGNVRCRVCPPCQSR